MVVMLIVVTEHSAVLYQWESKMLVAFFLSLTLSCGWMTGPTLYPAPENHLTGIIIA